MENTYDEDRAIVDKYNRRMLEDGISAENNYDPLTWEQEAHDTTLHELRE